MGSRRVFLFLICALLAIDLMPGAAAVELKIQRVEPIVIVYPGCGPYVIASSTLVELQRGECPITPTDPRRCVMTRPNKEGGQNVTFRPSCLPPPADEAAASLFEELLNPPCEEKEGSYSWCCNPDDVKCLVMAMVYEVRKRAGSSPLGACVEVVAGVDGNNTPYWDVRPGKSCSANPDPPRQR